VLGVVRLIVQDLVEHFERLVPAERFGNIETHRCKCPAISYLFEMSCAKSISMRAILCTDAAPPPRGSAAARQAVDCYRRIDALGDTYTDTVLVSEHTFINDAVEWRIVSCQRRTFRNILV